MLNIILEDLKRHTSMYLEPGNISYATVTAYIKGIDDATSGGALVGFREWLVIKVGGKNNICWTELVLSLLYPDVPFPRQHLQDAHKDELAVAGLFDLLTEFYEDKGQHGLNHIFLQHEKWKLQQSWHNSDCDNWVDL